MPTPTPSPSTPAMAPRIPPVTATSPPRPQSCRPREALAAGLPPCRKRSMLPGRRASMLAADGAPLSPPGRLHGCLARLAPVPTPLHGKTAGIQHWPPEGSPVGGRAWSIDPAHLVRKQKKSIRSTRVARPKPSPSCLHTLSDKTHVAQRGTQEKHRKVHDLSYRSVQEGGKEL